MKAGWKIGGERRRCAGPTDLYADKGPGCKILARCTTLPAIRHVTDRYANNRAEVSCQPTREREWYVRRFKWSGQAQRFLSVHVVVSSQFRIGRHLMRATHCRLLRFRAFD